MATRVNRPREVGEQGKLEYMTVGLRESEKALVDEWAWRLRKNRSSMCREFILKGLKSLAENKALQAQYPRPMDAEGEKTVAKEMASVTSAT